MFARTQNWPDHWAEGDMGELGDGRSVHFGSHETPL